MFKEFREFAMRGNVVDMAVGIIIGGAFGTIVKSLVDDMIMPPIGMALGGVDFSNFFVTLKEGATIKPYAALADARQPANGPAAAKSPRPHNPPRPWRPWPAAKRPDDRRPRKRWPRTRTQIERARDGSLQHDA